MMPIARREWDLGRRLVATGHCIRGNWPISSSCQMTPTNVSAEVLTDMEVQMTILGGEIVYAHGR